MNRDDDLRFDDTLREFLRDRADDTAGVRDSSAMSAAMAGRLRGGRRRRDATFARALVLAATLTVLLVLAAVSLFVGSQRPPVPTSSRGNGLIAYAAHSSLSPVYLVRPGELPRRIVPSASVDTDVVCPAFSPDGTMLAVGIPAGNIVIFSIDERGEVGEGNRLDSRASKRRHCPAWAPDASAVAYLDDFALEIDPLVGLPRRLEGWETAYDAVVRQFAIDYPADRGVQWSPDGGTIAVARPSGTWLVPVDLSRAHRLHDSPAETLSWSPDGTRLVVRTSDDTLVIRVRDGAIEGTLPHGRQPVWSPRSDRIAYMDDQGQVVVVGPDGADPTLVSTYGYNITWSPDGYQILFIRDVSARAYDLMSQAIDVDGNPVGNAVTVVPNIDIAGPRRWPPAESFSWQPVPRADP